MIYRTDAVFTLNGEKVYKSEVVKKTLAPVWNENFECQVASRVAADFWVDIFDWDRVGELLQPDCTVAASSD